MNRMFITATFKDGENRQEIEQLCGAVKASGFEDFCFIRDVEHYQKMFFDCTELMRRAKEEIEKSDYLLIDMTEKPTGRAIEAGMAYAMGKKVVVIMKTGTQIKDTTRGISEAVIEYDRIEDITEPLSRLLTASLPVA